MNFGAMKLTEHIRSIIGYLGEDPHREGLIKTPERIAQFYEEFLNPPQFGFTSFENDGSDEMIVQTDIAFYSLCEHHMLPFFGSAAIGYIPNGRIVGLSKLARTVDVFSRKLQNQERITRQVADCLESALTPIGVGVVLKARHLCMEMRGIQKRGTITKTSCLYGVFREKAEARAEFMALANNLQV